MKLSTLLFIGLLFHQNQNHVGAQEADIAPRIVGGVPPDECEYPYFLVVQRGNGFPPMDGSGFIFMGGAVLIHPYWAITSASVVDGLDQEIEKPSIFGGSVFLNGSFEKVSPVDEVFIHPSWRRSPILWQGTDIALLKLTCRVDLPTVALPEADFDVETETVLWVAGFGGISPAGPRETRLQHMLLRRQDNEVCSDSLGSRVVPPDIICAGERTGSVCQGDGGGPLVLKTDAGRHVLLGVTPQSIADCSIVKPLPFTSVAHVRDWIIDTMNENYKPLGNDLIVCNEMDRESSSNYCNKEKAATGQNIVGSLIQGGRSQLEAAELVKKAVGEIHAFVLMSAIRIARRADLLVELGFAFADAQMTAVEEQRNANAIYRLVELIKPNSSWCGC